MIYNFILHFFDLFINFDSFINQSRTKERYYISFIIFLIFLSLLSSYFYFIYSSFQPLFLHLEEIKSIINNFQFVFLGFLVFSLGSLFFIFIESMIFGFFLKKNQNFLSNFDIFKHLLVSNFPFLFYFIFISFLIFISFHSLIYLIEAFIYLWVFKNRIQFFIFFKDIFSISPILLCIVELFIVFFIFVFVIFLSLIDSLLWIGYLFPLKIKNLFYFF